MMAMNVTYPTPEQSNMAALLTKIQRIDAAISASPQAQYNRGVRRNRWTVEPRLHPIPTQLVARRERALAKLERRVRQWGAAWRLGDYQPPMDLRVIDAAKRCLGDI